MTTRDEKSGALSSMTIHDQQQSALAWLVYNSTRSGVSNPDLLSSINSPILGTPITASALTHGRQVAEDRNEPDMLQTKIVSDSCDLGLADLYS